MSAKNRSAAAGDVNTATQRDTDNASRRTICSRSMPVLGQIGAKHGKTSGQVALRYLTQNGIAVIPKSVHRERMRQNLDSLNFTLDKADMEQISRLDGGRSLFGWY